SRNPRELTIDVPLTPRPDRNGIGAAITANEDLRCYVDYIRQSLPYFIDRLAEHRGIAADCDDLVSRLDRRASADDGYRFERSAYLLRNALKSEAVTRNLTGKLAEAMTAGISGYSQIQYSAAETMDIYDLE